MKFFQTLLAALVLLLFAAGCASRNNYRECSDFFSFLVKNNVAVSKSQPLAPEPFRASSGMAFEVDGMDKGQKTKVDVAIYKFNTDVETTKKRLEEIKKSGCVYLLGVKLPTQIHGSFILVGYECCLQKKQILKAFEEFE